MMSTGWSRLGFSHFLAGGWLIQARSSWDDSATLHVRLMAIPDIFFMAKAKGWESKLGVSTSSLLPHSIGQSNHRADSISRGSTLCLLMAKGANIRNDEVLWLLMSCTTLAKKCWSLFFIRNHNLPPGATTAPHHGQAYCGGPRLMAGPKMWGGEENVVVPSLLQSKTWMFVTLSLLETLIKWLLLMTLLSLGTVSSLDSEWGWI